MPFDRSLYPKHWNVIRAQILERAGHKCEKCGVPNHAVGSRDRRGQFEPTCGNSVHDAAGNGGLSFKEARELVKHCNEWGNEKLVIIVLTIAHVGREVKHDKMDCRPEVLLALCQRCHLLEDLDDHVRHAATTRARKRAGIGQLELIEI